MEAPSKAKIAELQAIMTKMPLQVCCVMALPEFELKWSEVSQAVRNARLHMTTANIARIICRHVARSLSAEDVDDIVARLRLKMVATQSRMWHVLNLYDRCVDEPPHVSARRFNARLRDIFKKGRRNIRPQVQIAMLDNLMYASIQLLSQTTESSVLYMAIPLGQDVALVSTPNAKTVIRACVNALGYNEHQDAKLSGRDITSLLRISNKAWNGNADHLYQIPAYQPAPVILNNGIDYTNKAYDENYVDSILGPNPPLLTELTITTHKSFFDPSRLQKMMNLTIKLKSDDVAKSLKSWVMNRALAPTSEFFQIFHNIKSNKITYSKDDD
ncbi:hypothetical protein ACJJTC_002742 [Scirpophaga incertulas]